MQLIAIVLAMYPVTIHQIELSRCMLPSQRLQMQGNSDSDWSFRLGALAKLV